MFGVIYYIAVDNEYIVKENKEQRNYSKLKETKRTWQPNVMHNLSLNPGNAGDS